MMNDEMRSAMLERAKKDAGFWAGIKVVAAEVSLPRTGWLGDKIEVEITEFAYAEESSGEYYDAYYYCKLTPKGMSDLLEHDKKNRPDPFPWDLAGELESDGDPYIKGLTYCLSSEGAIESTYRAWQEG